MDWHATMGSCEQTLAMGEIAIIAVKFTGQEYDPETGFYYYNARYYDPQLGVFTTADTIVQDPTRSPAYNRHMYVYGNPIKYTDPTGHYVVTSGGGGGSMPSGYGGGTYDTGGAGTTYYGTQGPAFGGGTDGACGCYPVGDDSSNRPKPSGPSAPPPPPAPIPTAQSTYSSSAGNYSNTASMDAQAQSYFRESLFSGLQMAALIAAIAIEIYVLWPVFVATAAYYGLPTAFLGASASAGGTATAGYASMRNGSPFQSVQREASTLSIAEMGAASTGRSYRNLERVSDHVRSFGHDRLNEHMLQRLRNGAADAADKNFYIHELQESLLMRKGMSWPDAHGRSLQRFGHSPWDIYHPDAVRTVDTIEGMPVMHPDYYRHWGLE